MDNDLTTFDKKSINKVKSQDIGQTTKFKSEPVKRKSFIVNDAVRSLDLALGRLKKSKLVNGEYGTSTAHTSPIRSSGTTDMFIDRVTTPSAHFPNIDDASVMSTNFSQYELMRNLSQCNCISDGAFSTTTCNENSSLSDLTSKNEHLERYFRSAEIWNTKVKLDDPSGSHVET